MDLVIGAPRYEEFFLALTSKSAIYPYQARLQEVLASGGNVVLRAPTGAGKTWAVAAPFLYSWLYATPETRMADRLIYALPLRSLATGLYRSTTEAFGHYVAGTDVSPKPKIRLQIGGQQDDPLFEGGLIFTTIDQLLSGYIMCPVSASERLANVIPGSLLGSLLWFSMKFICSSGNCLWPRCWR